jgi:hypothetical protein
MKSLRKGGTVQICRNNLDASKLYSGIKKSRWKTGNDLLSFGTESVIQKYKD